MPLAQIRGCSYIEWCGLHEDKSASHANIMNGQQKSGLCTFLSIAKG